MTESYTQSQQESITQTNWNISEDSMIILVTNIGCDGIQNHPLLDGMSFLGKYKVHPEMMSYPKSNSLTDPSLISNKIIEAYTSS